MTMDKIPLQQMIMPLVVFDDTQFFAKDANHALTVDDIKAWEKKNGEVPKGAFAALRTDMYKDWESDPEKFKRFHYQIEVMANLDKVPEKGAVIVVTWPKVENGFGFPARAFAILP